MSAGAVGDGQHLRPRTPPSTPGEPSGQTRRRAFVEHVMGMPVSLHVRGDVDRPEVSTAVAQVWGVLRRADAVFSTWRGDSDLLRVRRGDLPAAAAHPWMVEVEQLCARAQERTAGLFNASYGAAGYDPTGLVKGWAVERAALHLADVPGISWCVNAGGDLLAGTGRGVVPGTWRVGVQDPGKPSRVGATVTLGAGGVATSGAAARGPHVVDPRTGVAIDRPGSATVWGPSLVWADVWATALFVDPVAGATALEGADPAYRSLLL